MKRVKAIRHGVNRANEVGVRQVMLLTGLVLASVSAQASVTISTENGNLNLIGAGSISIRNPGINIVPPAIPLHAPSATSSVGGSLNYRVGTSSGHFNEIDSSQDGSTVALDLDRKGYGYLAEASSQTGLAKARAETRSVVESGQGNNHGSSSANATSIWSDWFVISGGTGLGMASFASELNGMMASGKNGSAGYSLNIGYTTGAYCNYGYNLCGEADQSQTLFSQFSSLSGKGKSTLSQDVEGEFVFDYDKAFRLTVTLNVNTANSGMVDFALTSLANSLLLPEGASLVSASGFPYAQAVPEAETYAMMLVGLGLVGCSALRRRTISK